MKYNEVTHFLIDFYKGQCRKFQRIGINGTTKFGVTVSKKLIESTENRLNQLVTGEKTQKNMSSIEKGICRNRQEKVSDKFHDSNRTFLGNITSIFRLTDLKRTQQHVVHSYIKYADGCSYDEPQYIDKITTAYKSDIMMAISSHDK